MNVFLWILQGLLAFQAFAGGAFKVFQFDQIANEPPMGALSRGGWGAVGVFEMGCAVLLIVPTAIRRMPILTPLAATALALESFALAVLYGRYSLEMTATNPLVYVLAAGVVASLVAVGRYRSVAAT
jgi:hypothetical protein